LITSSERYIIVQVYCLGIAIYDLKKLQSNIPEKPSVIRVNLHKGWNMISLPIDVEDCSMTLKAYYFDTIEYQWKITTTQDLKAGRGYFVYSNDAVSLTFTGKPVTITEIKLYKGWNLIGTPYQVDIASMNHIYPKAYYWYNGKWILTSTLQPLKAYWIYAYENTSIILPPPTPE